MNDSREQKALRIAIQHVGERVRKNVTERDAAARKAFDRLRSEKATAPYAASYMKIFENHRRATDELTRHLCQKIPRHSKEIVATLLRRGANPRLKCDKTPGVYLMADSGETSILDLLLDAGGDPDALSVQNWTPLMAAASRGHVDVVRSLLRHGANAKKRGDFGHTSLLLAALHEPIAQNHRKYLEVARLLLAAGTSPNATDGQGWGPLAVGCLHGRDELVDLLLKNGADPNAALHDTRETPLHLAVGAGRVHIARRLLSSGAKPDAETGHGETPLTVAAKNGASEIVALLLQHHADPNVADEKGNTPLSYAAEWGHLDVASRLLSANANPDVPNGFGMTPLMLAAMSGNRLLASLLLRYRAKPNARDALKNTALLYATGFGHLDVVRVLLNAEAEPNAMNTYGHTPLTMAAVNGRAEIARLLVLSGARDVVFAMSLAKTNAVRNAIKSAAGNATKRHPPASLPRRS